MSSLDKKQDSYWRSLGELEDTREFRDFLDREFPEQRGDLDTDVSRRRFMQLMGASLAFAGVAGAGCRWEEEKILPLSRRPDDHVPGTFKHYATAWDFGGAATGLLVRAFDGRPTKIEGNPNHPFTTGGSTALAQGSILGLYDPDRSRRAIRRDSGQELPSSWSEFQKFAKGHFAGLRDGSGSVRVLSEATSSPTVAALKRELGAAFSQARWHEYEPLSRDNEREGTRMAFGAPHRVNLRIDRADVVVALDADLFVDGPASLRHAADFAAGRKPDEGVMNRVYSVESHFSSTGAAADHRLPLRSELVLPVLLAIEAEVAGDASAAPDAAFLDEEPVKAFLSALVRDLLANRGSGLVAVGPRQPPEVHAVAARLNDRLGNVGHAVEYFADPEPDRPSHVDDLRALAADIKAGEVDTLLVLGGNPAYDAPADLDFASLLGKVGTSIRLSEYEDETSAACTWHLPRAHYLESWGDARSHDGTVTIAQPIVEPLFGGRTAIELLATVLDREFHSGEELVRQTFDRMAGFTLDTDKAWRKALHDGFVADTRYRPARPTMQPLEQPKLAPSQKTGTAVANGELEVVFTPSSSTYDGRFANSGWLQETPDFMTKLTWDNAALVSPRTARALGVNDSELVVLKVGGRELEVPVLIQPGQAPFSISVALGYGRTHAGHVGGLASEGIDPVGFDAYRLRTSDRMYLARGATITGTGKRYLLATTQEHWAIDDLGKEEREDRAGQLIRETTLQNFVEKPNFVQDYEHGPPLESMWTEFEYDGHRWGMATDMSSCIGCNSCLVACQSENNVPVVGKEQVAVSREMHWIRIDRYFTGDPENPQVAHQPVTCQQCENAPCEQVCPVGATIHSSEGLNDMTYNRCIGTRYCANNCPYKVRRFNYLNWHEGIEDARNKVRQLLFNPDVTVRSRGVMEKCTFCVQRINRTKIEAKNDRRPIEDGEIKPACAQACPTDAIVFGDLQDKSSRVAKLHERSRSYSLLGYLNTKPRNVYLARIRNPHPDLG